jgi:hypothetical protein
MRSKKHAGVEGVYSPDASGALFRMESWFVTPVGENPPGDGTGGTQIPVASSNPLTNRVVQVNAFARGAVQTLGAGTIRAIVIAGTNLVFQPWFYDNTLATWVKFGATVTITVGTTNITSIGPAAMVGAKFFLQVVSQTGNPTHFGYAQT